MTRMYFRSTVAAPTALVVALFCTFGAPRIALAHPSYPTDIVAIYSLAADCTPGCELCHRTGAGGPGMVNNMFGQVLTDRGLVGNREAGTLQPALMQAAIDGSDVDGDGIGDIEELSSCMDPNSADAVALGAGEDVEYGCFASIERRGSDACGAGFVLLALGLAAFGRRLRRS